MVLVVLVVPLFSGEGMGDEVAVVWWFVFRRRRDLVVVVWVWGWCYGGVRCEV
ncbi:hypothetical protein Hanom_Chr12g01109631 [Helianthus anomalus]